MNFLRLHDSLISILFENEDILAIDKPYGFNAHTNDSKIEHSEFIQDGLIEIYEKHIGKRLHIIHRLDQTTTGVMIFGKSVESAKKYAEFFFDREVKKTYLFLTKNKSAQGSYLIDQQIIHKGRELEAKTQLTLLKKSNSYELWQANPFTGRNHQIRIHAKAAGISILGDEKYEGADFPFICLHNHRIEFPNGLVITSKAPIYFENTHFLTDPVLTKALFEADRRQRLFARTDANQCFRLVHNQNNAKTEVTERGFTLDQMGSMLVLNWFEEFWGQSEVDKFTTLANLLKKPILVNRSSEKGKLATDKDSLVLSPAGIAPASSPWLAQENQTQYELRAEAAPSTGLFTNQRLQRNWVQQQAKDKSVLNLFSYTCSYSVAAALGQAAQVTSVDTSKNALNWGRKNFELNQIDQQKHLFFCRDSFTFIEQCQSKNTKYDLIICDVPSFMKREKKLFKIKTDLEGFLRSCLSCLRPGGQILLSTHFDGFFIQDVRKIISQAQKSLQIPELEISCLLASMDFELPDEKTNLKSFLITLGSAKN